MAHPEQFNFFERLRLSCPAYFSKSSKILEIGSQNINGTVRDFFKNADQYIGIDLGMAEGVDWTIPGELIELPTGWSEVTISTECFEHAQSWADIFLNMIRITRPNGLIVITCASDGRSAHGTLDSDAYSSPFTQNYYKNLGINDFSSAISLENLFESHGFEVNAKSHDLYFWGIRSNRAVNESEAYWEDPMVRLARAQGQLSQAVRVHTALNSDLKSIQLTNESLASELKSTQLINEGLASELKSIQLKNEKLKSRLNFVREQKIILRKKLTRRNAILRKKLIKVSSRLFRAKSKLRTAYSALKEVRSSRSWKVLQQVRRYRNAIFLRKDSSV